MEYWETIDRRKVDGFDIELAFSPEDEDPRGHFASGDDEMDQEIIDKINSGEYLWFVARVTASKAGIVLGTDYLSGCCYSSADEFMVDNGYYPDMIRGAISEAKKKLAELEGN